MYYFLAGIFILHFLYYFFCQNVVFACLCTNLLYGLSRLTLFALARSTSAYKTWHFLRSGFYVIFALSQDQKTTSWLFSVSKKSSFYRQVALGSPCFIFVWKDKRAQYNIPAMDIMMKQSVKHQTLPKETQRQGVGCLNRINNSCKL